MILEQATFEAYGYYPKELVHNYKYILAACDGCGKIRSPRKCNYHALCSSCAHKGKMLTEEHKRHIGEGNKGKTLTDEHKCKIGDGNRGKKMSEESKHKISEAKKGTQVGAKNPMWKGGLVERKCKICGKMFFVPLCYIKYGHGNYCSYLCKIKAQRHNAKPEKTAPERIFEALCKKYLLPFTFVGNGALWLGNANPDFVHTSKKIVVEVFGDYWHSPLINYKIPYTGTVEGRTEQLKAEGYKTIILWESDLMREDAEEFVLHEMHKEGIGHKAKKEEE